MSDAIAAADAVVAAVDPGLSSPVVSPRDVVLVTGPWLAGTTSVLTALRDRMPDRTFVEAEDVGAGNAPSAVVFVVSAVAPLTESDCALLDFASCHTDLVIGVLSKTDVHRTWRDVLVADRAALAARAHRYERMPWVGVAAAPEQGEPQLDELVELLTSRLGDPDVERRNRLRAWQSRLEAVIARHRADGAGADREARVGALRARRDEITRERRLAKTERAIALRSQLQQARVQLAYFARNRCASVRTELAEDAAGITRRRIGGFEAYTRDHAAEVVAEVDEGITTHLGDVAAELGLTAPETPDSPPTLPEFAPPPLRSRRLETRLMMLLGAGFGLGIALAVSRLFAGLAPGLTVAGIAVGVAAGLALTVLVVGIRGLLHDRAVLDRWVGDVTAMLRSAVEERVAVRVLAAETALTADLAERNEADAATVAERIAGVDAELREHAIATARAAAVRDRRLPSLQRALDAVRTELYGEPVADSANGARSEPEIAVTESINQAENCF